MIWLGIILLLYAIVKIIIGILIFFPVELPLITKDKTISGKMFDITLFFFGILTFFHALGLLGFNYHISTKFNIIFQLILGIYLTGFYYLVLYTDVPIQKDMKYADHYLFPCLLSGIVFILFSCILVMFKYSVNNYLYGSVISILLFAALDITYRAFKPYNLYDLIMIPINTIA